MKNLGHTVKRLLVIIITFIFLLGTLLLYKNRAPQPDFINYICLYFITLTSLSGGITLGLLVSLIVIFGYASFLIVNSIAMDIPFSLSKEYVVWIAIFITGSFVIGFLGEKIKFLERLFRDYRLEIEDLVSIGKLSKLGNIHRFALDLDYEVARCKRSKSVFTLMYVVLTSVDEIQKRFGKEGQPKVMRQIAEVILRETRDADKKARVDEATHAIILTETPRENAPIVITKINNGVKAIRIEHKGDMIRYTPTISVGFSVFPEDGDSPAVLEQKAKAEQQHMGEE